MLITPLQIGQGKSHEIVIKALGLPDSFVKENKGKLKVFTGLRCCQDLGVKIIENTCQFFFPFFHILII